MINIDLGHVLRGFILGSMLSALWQPTGKT
jgi:hypothetical protein